MSALLEVILADVHFGDDSLEADKLVSHSAVESSGGDKVGSEIAFDLDIVPVQFGGGLFLKIIALFLFFKELLDQDIILRGVLDDLLSRLRVKGPVWVDIEGEVLVVREGLPCNIVCEKTVALILNVLVLDLHIGAFYKYYNLPLYSAPFKPFLILLECSFQSPFLSNLYSPNVWAIDLWIFSIPN